MSRKHLTELALTLSLVIFGGWRSQAATLTVGKANTPCPNAQYSSINDAVTAAAAGDVIEICPALYAEQLMISKPVALRGISVEGVGRVLIQPTTVAPVGGMPFAAVIAVVNAANVTIENLTIDASNNSISGCGTTLAGVHYVNSSGSVVKNAILGAKLADPTSCAVLFPGNGFGVHIEKDASAPGTLLVSVRENSISNFSRNGVLAVGAGLTADVYGNAITGTGPSTGVNQFGVFLANGTVGIVTDNMISQGTCGSIALTDCFTLRSEGVILRGAGDGTVIDGNHITNVQSGIFLNGATNARITNNVIRNVDALSAIHVQGMTNSLVAGNRIYNVGPVGPYASTHSEGCGINDVPGTGVANNTIRDNVISDAYCGVAYVSADWVMSGVYMNTLYNTLNVDNFPNGFPTPLEPGETASSSSLVNRLPALQRRVE